MLPPHAKIETYFLEELLGLPEDIGSKPGGPAQPKIAAFPVDTSISKKKQTDSIQISITCIDRSLTAFLRTRFIATLTHFFRSVTAPKETDTFTKTGYNKWAYTAGANK